MEKEFYENWFYSGKDEEYYDYLMGVGGFPSSFANACIEIRYPLKSTPVEKSEYGIFRKATFGGKRAKH